MAAPADVADAVEMVLDGLGYLAALDPTTLTAEAQARCLQGLEQCGAISTAARARILAAFTAGRGYCDDADYSPTSWLIHRTRITKGQARGHVRWSRRTLTHPQVLAALAEGIVLTESMALIICGWTDKLPAGCRQAADEILIAAARAGARKEDLAGLAAEIYARSLPEDRGRPGAGLRGPQAPGARPPSPGPGSCPGTSLPSARRWSRRSWTPCRPRGARRTPAPGSSATTMRWKTRCAAWSRPGCCRSGPGSRSSCGGTCPWLSCGPWMTGRCCSRSGPGRWPSGGPSAARLPPRPAATARPGWTARPPPRRPVTPPSSRS